MKTLRDSDNTYDKMSVFEQLVDGLTDGISQAKGELNLKTTILPGPPPALSKKRVIAIRRKTGMSQAVFACFLNVPTKTLQSWEQGARTPKAGEARLLQMFEVDAAQTVQLVSMSGRSNRAKRKSA